MSTVEEKIAQMYDSQLKSQKEQLDTDYKQAILDLDAQQKKNQQTTDANLNRTAVEAQKAAVNNAELHNAYGLSSGTRAQARLAQENQLQADMTALRAAQQNADADVERQRSLLAQAYSSEIRKAQAENDLAKAEALYAAAKEEEDRLLAKQEAGGKLMAEVAGDYSLLGKLYGLSEEEIAALAGTEKEPEETDAPENPTGPTVSNEPVASPQTKPGNDNSPSVDSSWDTADSGGNSWFDAVQELIDKEKERLDKDDPPEDDPSNAPPMTPDMYKDIVSEVTGTSTPSPSQPTTLEEYADLPTDEASVLALGFGPISAERIEELLAAGIIEEYVEDGYIKYRRKKAAGSALNPWWKQGG